MSKGDVYEVTVFIKGLHGNRLGRRTKPNFKIFEFVGPHIGKDDHVAAGGRESMGEDNRFRNREFANHLSLMEGTREKGSRVIGPDGSHSTEADRFSRIIETGSMTQINHASVMKILFQPCTGPVLVLGENLGPRPGQIAERLCLLDPVGGHERSNIIRRQ